MMRAIREWIFTKWTFEEPLEINRMYYDTFSSPHGQKVLFHLLDRFYCVTYNGTDNMAGVTLNGQRMVVQEILERMDQVEHPSKYTIPKPVTETESLNGV